MTSDSKTDPHFPNVELMSKMFSNKLKANVIRIH